MTRPQGAIRVRKRLATKGLLTVSCRAIVKNRFGKTLEVPMITNPEETLAIAGGAPVRNAPMPGENGRLMGDAEIEAVTRVIRSGQLGRHGGTSRQGPRAVVRRALRGRARRGRFIRVSSSPHLHCVVNPEPGDEIITTPCSDFGTVLGILFQNAIPVFRRSRPGDILPRSSQRRVTDHAPDARHSGGASFWRDLLTLSPCVRLLPAMVSS